MMKQVKFRMPLKINNISICLIMKRIFFFLCCFFQQYLFHKDILVTEEAMILVKLIRL